MMNLKRFVLTETTQDFGIGDPQSNARTGSSRVFLVLFILRKIFQYCFRYQAREANCAEPYLTYGERQFD